MKLITALFLLAATSITVFADETKPSPVFITAGQSNADGRETIEYLPSYLNGGYKFLHFANVTRESDGTFSDFEFGKRFAFCDITHHYIEKALGRDFYAIKCAYGGTSITPGATHAHLPVWYADSKWINSNKAYRGNIDEGKSLTLALIEGFKDCVEKTLSHLANGYDVKAIMWHQGESDRRKSAEYYQNFKDMINFMREQIYLVTGDESDKTLPFILGTVPHGSKQYNVGVEKAQLQIAKELTNVYVIDLSDAGLRSDALHFDGPWTEYVGKMMYNKLVDLRLVEGDRVEVKKPIVNKPTSNIKADAERQWHFTSPWSEESTVALQKDAQWILFKNMGFRLSVPIPTMQELECNSKGIQEMKGLFFKCYTGNRLIINPGKYICLYHDNISMIIPKVRAGQTIAITTQAIKGNRGLTAENMQHLELISGGVPAMGKVTNIWKVKDDVKDFIDLEFHSVGGGIYVYSIEITLANL